MIDWTKLSASVNEQLWLLLDENVSFEISIVGDQHGPHLESLEIAKQIALHVEILEQRAKHYLDNFLKYDTLSPKWSVASIEFGSKDGRQLDQFDLCLVLEEDIYGYYYVRFNFERQNPAASQPIAFGRQQT